MLDQLTVLAPGLLGGSVARAARARGAAKRIVIWARRPEVRVALAQQPWCDAVAETPELAVKGANLVVIAATVDTIIPLARQIGAHLSSGTIVTDVGSVKSEIARQGPEAVGHKAQFVGSHPMAGSEKTGWENSTADLFEKRTCFVTPLEETDPAAAEMVGRFWRKLGATVAEVPPATHDAIVAHISHLPQLLASTLCAFLAGKDAAWRDFAGNGLRDTTRIAGSDPALWRTILEGNRAEVLAAIRGFQWELAKAEKALAASNWEAIADLMARGKAYRDGMK